MVSLTWTKAGQKGRKIAKKILSHAHTYLVLQLLVLALDGVELAGELRELLLLLHAALLGGLPVLLEPGSRVR